MEISGDNYLFNKFKSFCLETMPWQESTLIGNNDNPSTVPVTVR